MAEPAPPFSAQLTAWRIRAAAAAPGLGLAVAAAAVATGAAAWIGGPAILYALLIGLPLYGVTRAGRWQPGIALAGRGVLRLGVALLGARITADQILALGPGPIVTVLVAVLGTIGVAVLLARWLRLPIGFGVLTGGATAICGASAALAISAVLPRHADHERDTLFAVVGVTFLSTVVMVLYPGLAVLLGLRPDQAGLFLGGSIHDVAQVVGAGYMMGPATGDVATFTKMLRVAMLLPVVLAITLVVARLARADRAAGDRTPGLPWFLIAFAALVGINSVGVLPPALVDGMVTLSGWCLVTAIAALGMKTSLKAMAGMGLRPLTLLVAETVVIAVLVLAAVLALG